MEYYPTQKKPRFLDFTRPTFNEPMLQIPSASKVNPRSMSSCADDEESINETNGQVVPKAKQTENINVYLRLRPSKEYCELYKYKENSVIIPKVSQQAVHTEEHYKFTSILNDCTSQKEIYNEIVRPVLSNDRLFDCRGCTFASYGVSSSGKTYTILGDSAPGLVPRAITQIFSEYKTVIAPFPCVKIVNDQISLLDDSNVEYEVELLSEFINESSKLNKGKIMKNWSHEDINSEHMFKAQEDIENKIQRLYVWFSFVEIYNEKITDLLSNNKNTVRPLKIFSNHGNSYIQGSTWLYAENIETAFSILSYGLNKIKYASTGINDHSSRSHTILIMNLIAETGIDYQFSSFKFCDLAGAERVKKTNNIGERLKEAGGINSSLMVLGRCLEGVQFNQSKINKKLPDRVVPVRDSKLTLLLQSSLLGYEKFVMIVNLYPTADFFEENLNVLKFGSIANSIITKKSEVRTFRRQSYSYLMQNIMQNSSMNGTKISDSIYEVQSEQDESELDDSFRWNSMDKEKLLLEVRTQKAFIDELIQKYGDSQKEHDVERKKILDRQKEIQERINKRNEDELQIQREYHEKKMKNMEIRYERLLKEAENEIHYLKAKLKKLKPDEVSDDDFEEESEEEYDDVIEVDE